MDLLRDLSQVHNKSKEQSLGFDLLWTSPRESTASLQVHIIQVLQHALQQFTKIEQVEFRHNLLTAVNFCINGRSYNFTNIQGIMFMYRCGFFGYYLFAEL